MMLGGKKAERIIPLRLTFLGQLVIILCFLGVCGCSLLDEIKGSSYKADLRTLEKGKKAFQKGDFKKAEEIFEILSRNVGNKNIGREALYGLACARLILAENPDDFKDAVVLWKTWSQLAPKEIEKEDPRMIGIVLERVFPLKKEASNTEIWKSQENRKYRKLLKAKEEEIEYLKQQIEALKEIDQKMQEKKKEISSP